MMLFVVLFHVLLQLSLGIVGVIIVIDTPPEPAETSFYLHKEFEISKSAWYGFAWSKCDLLTLLWPTCRIFFAEPEPWAYKQWTHFFVFEILK